MGGRFCFSNKLPSDVTGHTQSGTAFKDSIILIFGIDLLTNPSVNKIFYRIFHSSVSFLTFFFMNAGLSGLAVVFFGS